MYKDHHFTRLLRQGLIKRAEEENKVNMSKTAHLWMFLSALLFVPTILTRPQEGNLVIIDKFTSQIMEMMYTFRRFVEASARTCGMRSSVYLTYF